MIIEKIKSSANKFIITVDGKEQVIACETAIRYKLNQGKSMDFSEYNAMLNESEQLFCKDYLYKMIAKYQKSEKGYRDKLYQLGYHKKAVDKAIDSAKNYGYIDDNKFCENYISIYKNKKGVYKLRQELKNKGISLAIINKYLDSYESSDKVLENLCAKYMKSKEKNFDTKQKLYRHLISKGFSYEEVSKAVDNCFNSAE